MADAHKIGDINPWVPMTRPIDLKHLGKLAEEANELGAAIARCVIQGIDEKEPTTGKPNRDWLRDEIADVIANIELVITHFDLDVVAIDARATRKSDGLRQWHHMLVPSVTIANPGEFVSLVLCDVCELPDYSSPDDQPNLLQATTDELSMILERRLGLDAAKGEQA